MNLSSSANFSRARRIGTSGAIEKERGAHGIEFWRESCGPWSKPGGEPATFG